MNKLSLAEVAQVTGAEKNSDAEIFFEGVTTDSRKLNSGTIHFDDREVANEAITEVKSHE